MSNDPFVVTIPIRGIIADNSDLTVEEIFAQSWSLIGPNQYPLLAEIRGRNDSVGGNIESIKARLTPSSLLLVRYYPGQRSSVWDEQRAMRVLAALNIALLLSNVLDNPPRPRPLFRARYAEYCDLPLAFDVQGTRSVGHTSRLGLLAGDMLPLIRRDVLANFIKEAPQIVTDVLSDRTIDSRQARLAEGMVNILNAFDTLTTGAFVSRLVSAAERLLDSQTGRSNVPWSRLEARLHVAVPSDCVSRLLQIRHDYTHAGIQPENDQASFEALAMALECWGVMNKLYSRVSRHSDVEVLLDCAARSRHASNDLAVLARVREAVERGPIEYVSWIRYWLEKNAT